MSDTRVYLAFATGVTALLATAGGLILAQSTDRMPVQIYRMENGRNYQGRKMARRSVETDRDGKACGSSIAAAPTTAANQRRAGHEVRSDRQARDEPGRDVQLPHGLGVDRDGNV
jgi:hypothetical protein